MSFDSFIKHVMGFLDSSGGGFSVEFKLEDGKYIADCFDKSNGDRVIRCIGNAIGKKMTVRFSATLSRCAMI